MLLSRAIRVSGTCPPDCSLIWPRPEPGPEPGPETGGLAGGRCPPAFKRQKKARDGKKPYNATKTQQVFALHPCPRIPLHYALSSSGCFLIFLLSNWLRQKVIFTPVMCRKSTFLSQKGLLFALNDCLTVGKSALQSFAYKGLKTNPCRAPQV